MVLFSLHSDGSSAESPRIMNNKANNLKNIGCIR